MPAVEEISGLREPAKSVVEASYRLLTDGLEAPHWTDSEVARAARDLGWWRLAAPIASIAMQRDTG
jgi:hypothetical protein